MNNPEALEFIKQEIEPRWREHEMQAVELRDWIYFLRPLDPPAAQRAIREHAASQEFTKKPNLAAFRKLAALYQPAKKKEQAEPTFFLMYMGESEKATTLVPGYYYPIYTLDGRDAQAAESERQKRVMECGGEWRVIEGTERDMVRMRREMSGHKF